MRVLLRNGPDGYEVTVPTRFGAPSRPHTGVISYDLGGRPFTISVGDRSGSLYVCGSGCVPSNDCQDRCQPINRPVRTLDDLQELLISVPDPMGLPLREIHSEGRLGGVAARTEKLASAGYLLGPPAYYRVFAIRDGRPVVLTFDYWSTRNGGISRDEIASIIASFHFLKEKSPAPRLRPYVNRVDGYRIDLPSAWIRTARQSTGNSRWTDFRTGRGASSYPVLRVSVGSADGRISLCSADGCGTYRATTLGELAELVKTNPPNYPGREEQGTYVLRQEVAQVEKPSFGNSCLGCLLSYYNVYGIHEGRPFLIRFDYWTVRFNRMDAPRPWELVERIVDSFELVEPRDGRDRNGTLVRYENRAGGYSVRIPSSWLVRETGSGGDVPGRVTFQIPTDSGSAAYEVMSIWAASRPGRLTICDPVPTPLLHAPACRAIRVHTLRELARALQSAPDPMVRERSRRIQLGGEPGWLESPEEVRWWPRTYCGPNVSSAHHAFAFHDGRPVVLRINYCHTLYPLDLVDRIVAGFRFLD